MHKRSPCPRHPQTLDTSKPKELAQLVSTSLAILVLALYVRFYRYGWLAYRMLSHAYETQHYGLTASGALCLGALALYNTVLVVDSVKRVAKFGPRLWAQPSGSKDD